MNSDPVYVAYQTRNDEQRYKVLGVTKAGRVLVGIWTPREGRVRPLQLILQAANTEISIGSASDEAEARNTCIQIGIRRSRVVVQEPQIMDKDLVEAAKKSKRLDQATLKTRLAASKSRVISIRLPEIDLELARQQAVPKGLPYQTYIKSVLHQALRQAK